jgi:hypothetical protein
MNPRYGLRIRRYLPDPPTTLAIVCGLCAAWVAIRHANQAPLDLYSFRQSQTALTAYWLKLNGFAFAYETPVVGPPWSIPFEFPIYQWIVALVSSTTGAPLDATGRLVSFAFLIGCLFPVRTIVQRLQLSPPVFPIFCALMLSSPTCVYWGRTFMIETTALFFCLVAVRWFLDLLLRIDTMKSALFFIAFMSLGVLQKATTGLPILAVLGAVFAWQRVDSTRSLRALLRSKDLASAIACFGIPLAIGLAWTSYTDHVKSFNPFAATVLTTSALAGWNWGTVAQRFSIDLFRDVIWKEILDKNCAGVLGIALLVFGLWRTPTSHVAKVIGVSLALGIVPLFIFTNLHIEHSYYQSANVVFFLFALAVATGQVLHQRTGSLRVVTAVTALLVASNAWFYITQYRPWVEQEYTFTNSTETALSSIVRANVAPDHWFLAFDFSWTSSLAYLSERKAFMVSDVFTDYEAMRKDPSRFVDPAHLSAVVACPTEAGRLVDLLDWSMAHRWMVGSVGGCYVVVPEHRRELVVNTKRAVDCNGLAVSLTPVKGSERLAIVRVRLPRKPGRPNAGDAWFVVLTHRPAERQELLDVGAPRGDGPDEVDEYSRLVDLGAPGRSETLSIHVLRDGRIRECSSLPTAATR